MFATALVEVLLFVLIRGLDRQRYFRPVLYGVLFGFGSFVLFGAGIVSFMLGGMIAGYILAREVGGFFKHFRAGALSGLLMYSFFIAYSIILIVHSPAQVIQPMAESGDLHVHFVGLCVVTGIFLFQGIVLVGAAAGLGGILRKFLAPPSEHAQTQAGTSSET